MRNQKTYRYIAAGVLTLSMVSANLPAFAEPTSDVLTSASATTTETKPQQLSSLRVLAGVHTDAVSMNIENGKLNLFTYADVAEGNRTRLNPDEILFHLPITKETSFKVTSDYDFIAPVGQEIYYAPQTQIQGIIWPGWNTEDIAPGQVKGDAISLELTNVEAPEGGSVEVFLDSIFGGAQRVWSSKDSAYKTYSQAVHSHVHGNWAFTKPGVYKLTYKASATLVSGQAVEDSQTYTFVVGDIPADPQPEASAEPTAAPSQEPTTQPSSPSAEPSQPTATPSQETSKPAQSPAPNNPSGQAETTPAPAPEETGASSENNQNSTSTSDKQQAVNPPATEAKDSKATTKPAQNKKGNTSQEKASGTQNSGGAGQEKCYAQEEIVGKVAPSLDTEQKEGKPASLNRTLATYTIERAVQTSDRNQASEGHFDFGAVLSGGALSAKVKDDRHQPAQWVTPQNLNFILGDKAKAKLPAGMEDIAPAGSQVYLIGATQVAGVPWLGWNTQDPELIAQAAGPASMSLKSFEGPGKLSVFLSGNFGAGNTTVFDSNSMGSFSVPMNTHQHGNWVFTAPGEYQVTIGWTIPMKDGSTKTAQGTLHFTVGDPAEAPQQTESKSEEKNQGSTKQEKQDGAGQAAKPATGTVDEATGIVTKADGTQVRIVGKTASGADCTLSADELKQAQKDSAAGKLAYTGFSSGKLALFGAGTLALGALVLLAARRRKNA